ncbi:AI-2E family transporter [Clostridium paraputrificum]|uniref:AI-2E family transporter n=1 Tax=Clostridium paraputrificum TaxID=29363 RepID=UPI003D33B360
MNKRKVISNLIIANLALILLIMIGRFQIVHDFINVIIWVMFTPIIFGVFLFYILKPLNEVFIRKGLKRGKAASLTLIISAFILAAIVRYLGGYFIQQVIQLKTIISETIQGENIIGIAQEYIESEGLKSVTGNLSTQLMGYINILISNAKEIFDKGMMLFSNILLVILITFFLLKDGNEVKPYILKYCPGKYRDVVDETLGEGDNVLSTYIIGQAVVAFSLATMVFIGYTVIGMPSGLLLAFVTFILAFIPFVGFFISMIIPYVIAIALGFDMIVKLSILFVIAQTLKGRVVVPFIMGKAMKIHPITDIFLVVGAAAIGGPIAAFCVVPIYSLVKVGYGNLKKGKV